ncbi:hypothetical protein GQ607_009860 [Colletotrichum asianum]|uniref:Uncharacterized protein n=1 Tax=Colletotrichum asianum TaxID=702518 RepID=A0A8H3WAL4_9PEZI|nr:hypothetical protein GQ607_009860 [Colletotrichum asianum]
MDNTTTYILPRMAWHHGANNRRGLDWQSRVFIRTLGR